MNSPITIEGALSRMSLTKRTTLVTRAWRPYSAIQVPARMPSGVPMTIAAAQINALPVMALSRPPASPGGGVLSVNTCNDRPPMPFHTRMPRMSASQQSPRTVAAIARLWAIAFLRRRVR